MARVKNPANRGAIFKAAVREIAEAGLGAPTAKIAKRAGIASGTLFTYFPTKEVLLNELYLELKAEVYARVNEEFPHSAGLKLRTRHVWSSFLNWAIEFPEKRKVSMQLNLSDVITAGTRLKAAEGRGTIDRTLGDLREQGILRELPAGFAAATMSAMQETTMDFIARKPKQREELIERAFEVYWRAVK